MHEHELMKYPVARGQVLMVCTSCDHVGDRHDTGVWLSEVAVPYYIFKSNGYDVTFASISGGAIPIDQAALSEGEKRQHPELERFLADESAMQQLGASVPLATVARPPAYDCVFLAGGQGAMADMPASAQLHRVLADAAQHGKLIAAVCHGPAGLLGAVDGAGKPLLAGRTVACFTAQEEDKTGAADCMPFQLEQKLREAGASVRKAQPGEENALRDGFLITGQNHASAARVANLVVEALNVHPTGPEGSVPIVGRAVAEA
ncbi:hypothetical protein CHLRE_03g163550v5 [Chlamydomonas reinhardtii]|uniref:DJ-1/PfpI domain-containing protein n=1 Tax=Chlamydomonas reinhardtii TaxID=3055 RepID=A0A2K3DWJ8_CHLRE|nr:uncharacterized protein CHLRE_03g163550v5 [Chlamydomonas reinhardtii]PNW84909.1 hypothetical protein CHLRE_03g163550v5 [Chlamydomonas reinhardtii]